MKETIAIWIMYLTSLFDSETFSVMYVSIVYYDFIYFWIYFNSYYLL